MTDIILHHYETSPYSEKVRLGLGLKGLAWASVEIPVIMPKPDLTALTGGYRKTPVLQIGADIYCDSQLIMRETRAPPPQPEFLSGGPRRGRRARLVGREDNVQPGRQHRLREETRCAT
jgi:glutathione S-transferase